MREPLEHALPRAMVEDICDQLGYDLRDIDRIVITPWRVEVTVGFAIDANDPPPIDPWKPPPNPWAPDEGGGS